MNCGIITLGNYIRKHHHQQQQQQQHAIGNIIYK